MLIVESKPKSMEAETYRTLRTNIQYSALRKNKKTLLITSPDLKEGKSTVCGNLGLAFSQNGQSVILVDCDFRKPILHKLFNISNESGVADVLNGEEKLEEVIKEYSTNLSILPSGESPANPSELLGTDIMKDLLNFLSERYDVVLLDSPPVDVVTDAQVLAAEVDGTIIVVKAEQTKSKRLVESVNLLKNVDANIIGIVLNGANDYDKEYKEYYVK